jgi:hypothetical protein
MQTAEQTTARTTAIGLELLSKSETAHAWYALAFFFVKEMIWDCVDAVEIFGVDVWVVFIPFAGWVISDVEELILEVVFVSNAVFVITAVPDFSWRLLAGCEGVSAFDVLNALCG